jgi:hypothetical protein
MILFQYIFYRGPPIIQPRVDQQRGPSAKPRGLYGPHGAGESRFLPFKTSILGCSLDQFQCNISIYFFFQSDIGLVKYNFDLIAMYKLHMRQ